MDASGRRQPFRFRFEPLLGADHLADADAAARAPDFLLKEVPERLANGPVGFRMLAQLANPGDQTKDPTQAWPADRRVVDLGTITITRAVPDSAGA